MITPAQRRREFVAAKKAGAAAPQISRNANAYELMLARLDADRRRLKLLQSVERKIEAKRGMLREYAAWIDGVLSAGKGGQDDIVTSIMVWRIDTGDYAGALSIAGYVLKHGLTLPDHYKRTPGCLIAEEIADAALRAFSAGGRFELSVLTHAQGVTEASDMPDQVRAKLYKAIGLAQEETSPEAALTAFQKALSLHDKVGVKKDIERVERTIRNQVTDDRSQQSEAASPPERP